jgi:hypothetical protein
MHVRSTETQQHKHPSATHLMGCASSQALQRAKRCVHEQHDHVSGAAVMLAMQWCHVACQLANKSEEARQDVRMVLPQHAQRDTALATPASALKHLRKLKWKLHARECAGQLCRPVRQGWTGACVPCVRGASKRKHHAGIHHRCKHRGSLEHA